MPGLIDAHWHTMFAAVSADVALSADSGYVHLVAGGEAERTLLPGFTSVRDAGGPAVALKRAIDEGVVAGPRIYPSGAFITQTAGHGDFRPRHEVPRDPCRHLSHEEVIGAATIADGVDQVLRAVREQLMWGRVRSRSWREVESPRRTTPSTSRSTPRLKCTPRSKRPRTGAPT